MKRLILITVLAALSSAAAADGRLSGYACGEYTGNQAVDVQISDDSAPMLQVRDSVIAALQRKKTPVSGNAAWVLDIETETTREAAERKGRDLGSVRDGSSERVNARVNLWSNREDSIIGGRKDGIVSGARDRVRVSIIVNERSTGKCIWRGEAVHDTAGLNQWKMAEKIARHLVNTMGKATRDEEFTVD